MTVRWRSGEGEGQVTLTFLLLQLPFSCFPVFAGAVFMFGVFYFEKEGLLPSRKLPRVFVSGLLGQTRGRPDVHLPSEGCRRGGGAAPGGVGNVLLRRFLPTLGRCSRSRRENQSGAGGLLHWPPPPASFQLLSSFFPALSGFVQPSSAAGRRACSPSLVSVINV